MKLILPLLLILSVPLMGADKKKLPKVIPSLKALAEKGNAAAQCQLGVQYMYGAGVVKDFKEAVKWYRKSAELGYAEAQNNLGAMYYRGQGTEKNDREAVKWFRKAAEQGRCLRTVRPWVNALRRSRCEAGPQGIKQVVSFGCRTGIC